MKDQSGNSFYVLKNTASCAAIANRAERRWLIPFLEQERSASVAAKLLGVTVTAMYKRIQHLLALGLLEQTKLEPRKGKAIRYYKAVHHTFFIPFRTFPPEQIRVVNQDFYQTIFTKAIERLYRQTFGADWGSLTHFMPSGDIRLEIVDAAGQPWQYLADTAPAVAVGWNPIWLDPTEAKIMQQEIVGVLKKYLDKKGSRAYLLGLFLTDAHEEFMDVKT
jgi:hypothetical protein